MANCNDYCADSISPWASEECDGPVAGGSNAFILLSCGHGIVDFSSEVEIQAAIDDSKAFLMTGVNFSFGAPSPITQTSIDPCAPDKTTNYDRTALLVDGAVSNANINFYNSAASGRTFEGFIAYKCDEDKVFVVESTTTLEGGLILPNTQSEQTRFETTIKWRQINNPAYVNAPAGIF